MRAAWNVFSTIVMCLIGLHWLTCAWFASGRALDGWVNTEGPSDFMDLSTVEQYRVTLEWAISRIHGYKMPK